jgi:hypothetical protein
MDAHKLLTDSEIIMGCPVSDAILAISNSKEWERFVAVIDPELVAFLSMKSAAWTKYTTVRDSCGLLHPATNAARREWATTHGNALGSYHLAILKILDDFDR